MIVVVRRAALGDFVLTLPVVRALQALGPVHVLTDPRYRVLLPPGVTCAADDTLWRGQLPEGVRLGVAFSPLVAEALRAAGAPEVRQVAARPPPGVSAARHYAGVLDGLDLPVEPPWIPAPEVADPRAPVVLAPGSGGREKRWPMERWREVAAALDVPVVWVRGPDEDGERWPVPAGVPDLAGLIGLAASCGAWLGPDAGPSHLAAAVGAPVGVVFGPTEASVWAPHGAEVFPWDAAPARVAEWARDQRLLRFPDVRVRRGAGRVR